MILGIDIGNSNIVFGISENNEWLKVWRIQTDPMKTADEYEVIFRSLFASSHIANPDIRKVIISCVVPSLNRSFSEMIGQMLGFQPVFVGPDMYEKLPIQVLNPYEIGADLVVNATAAYSHYAHLCMVIDFGTALTFTTISETGAILGVAIAPGLRTAMRSLASNTAQLPHVQLTAPPSVMGTNTIHAIQSGLIIGYTGLVGNIIETTEKELGKSLSVIATGGLAYSIAPYCKKIHRIDENLTLDGLKIIADTIL